MRRIGGVIHRIRAAAIDSRISGELKKEIALKNNSKDPLKILIICLSSIGDVLHMTMVARAIKKAFPKSQISWVVETKSKDVIEGNSDLEHVFVWQRKEWNIEAKKTGNYFTPVKNNWRFFQIIRKENFDIAIDLHGMYRSDLISYVSGAKYRICLPNPKEICVFANIHTPNRKFPTVYERYLSVLTHLGIDEAEPIIKMSLSSSDEHFAQSFMNKHNLQPQNFFVFNPSTSIQSKCWPLENYAQLGDLLADEFKIPIVIFGAAYDKYMAQAIAGRMSNPVIDATGTMTLNQLGAVAAKASVFISGDTGPLHIAYAVQVPSVALFGPTKASYYHIPHHNRIALQAPENSLSKLAVEEVLQAVRLVFVSKQRI